jgi:tetratricopeptide (TPR) repeat protein
MNTCASCHKDIYDNYMETGMGMSFGLATLSKSNAKFGEHALVYDKDLDYYYKPYFKDSVLYILEFRLNGKDTTHKRLEKIDFIIGSGHHTNSHLINRNGYLYQAPITFYTQEGKWDLAPGFEKGLNSRFSRIIATECLTCHNHYPKHFSDSENKYKDIPTGIECERCHGPGSIHVKEKLKGNIVDTSKYADYTITNPRHLPRDLQMDICQRCHLQGVAVLNENKSFFDFKPGMKLSEIMQVYLPRFTNSHERFIMASQADRLRLSPCYLKSEDLSCITCHNPHFHVKSKEKNSYNKACLKCHQESKKNFCSVAPSERKSANDDCTSCHMKRTGSIDIPHITITDHNISKETARKKITDNEKNEIAKFLGLSCLTTNHPTDLDKAKGYLALHDKFMKEKAVLDSVRFYLDKSKEPEDKKFSGRIHYLFAKEDYASIVENAKNQSIDKIEDAWTCYRIGEGFYRMNQLKEARIYFEKAVKLRKHNLDFQEKLGVLYARLGDYEKAKDVFGFVLTEDSARPLTMTNLGLIAASSNSPERALYYYNKALYLDPDFETALVNKSALLIYQKKNSEAKAILEHLIKKHPNNRQAEGILKSLQ